jgi:hypothetical protein
MRGTGAIQTVPLPADFITDTYLKRVRSDAKLNEFANRTR